MDEINKRKISQVSKTVTSLLPQTMKQSEKGIHWRLNEDQKTEQVNNTLWSIK